MMWRPTLVLIAVVSVLAVFVGPAAWAGPPTDQLRVQIDKVLRVLADPELQKDGKIQERRVAIRKIASDIFDFNEITKRSLGRHWQARTPAEQAEFVGLLTDLLERTYISKIEGYTGEKVAFVGEALDSGVATVRSRIVTKQGTEIPVEYRMYQAGNRWLTYDVSVEGISLVANYRTQFNAIIQRSSYQELVKTMRAKQAEAREPVVAKRREPEPTGAAGRAEGRPAPLRRQSP
ncbi:MAG: ABC transporter substrate-binding protein [Candidatus Rokubacteria bacterium]|nr:ABC transporter substrate-binding protein [Candidatus Rokubacteria bacterium]